MQSALTADSSILSIKMLSPGRNARENTKAASKSPMFRVQDIRSFFEGKQVSRQAITIPKITPKCRVGRPSKKVARSEPDHEDDQPTPNDNQP